MSTDREEVLRIPSSQDAARSVKLFAAQDQAAPALMGTGQLVVYTHSNGVKAQVGEVFWTLGAQTVCVRINATAFSFSIPECKGLFITLILAPGTPDDELQALVDVLNSTCDYHGEAREATAGAAARTAAAGLATPAFAGQPPSQATAEVGVEAPNAYAAKALRAAAIAESFILAAAQAASNGLARGAQIVNQRVPPAQQPAHVSDTTLRRLEKLRNAAGAAASFTGTVAKGVARATVRTASSIAVHVTESSMGKGLGRAMESGGMDTRQVSQTVLAGVTALDQVLEALQEAGLQVTRSLASATTQVVDHRYGPEAAAAAGLGMGAAVHVVEAQANLKSLRPTRIIKKTAKHVARQVATGGPAVRPGAPISADPTSPQGVLIEEVEDDDVEVQPNGRVGRPLLEAPPQVPSANSNQSSFASQDGRPTNGPVSYGNGTYMPPDYVAPTQHQPPVSSGGVPTAPPASGAPPGRPLPVQPAAAPAGPQLSYPPHPALHTYYPPVPIS